MENGICCCPLMENIRKETAVGSNPNNQIKKLNPCRTAGEGQFDVKVVEIEDIDKLRKPPGSALPEDEDIVDVPRHELIRSTPFSAVLKLDSPIWTRTLLNSSVTS
ncbi:hypothetical protein FKM82_024353 [Ascaphus truei]